MSVITTFEEKQVKYKVYAYYDAQFRGIAGTAETDDWSTVEQEAHQFLSKGNLVEICNTETGGRIRINPDVYFKGFEGEFPVTPDELQ